MDNVSGLRVIHSVSQVKMVMLFRFESYLLENESGKRREVWEGGQSRLVGEDSERDESADKVKITSLLNI